MDNERLCVIQGNRILGASEGSQELPAHPSDKGWSGVWKSIEVQKASDRVVCFGQAADHRNRTVIASGLIFGTSIGAGAWWRNFGSKVVTALRLGINVASVFV